MRIVRVSCGSSNLFTENIYVLIRNGCHPVNFLRWIIINRRKHAHTHTQTHSSCYCCKFSKFLPSATMFIFFAFNNNMDSVPDWKQSFVYCFYIWKTISEIVFRRRRIQFDYIVFSFRTHVDKLDKTKTVCAKVVDKSDNNNNNAKYETSA